VPENIGDKGRIKWLDDVLNQIRAGEQTITVNGNPAPPAYVFITNHPFLYNLDSYNFSSAAVAEGFKIPDFKIDSAFLNIRDALASREKHIDMLDLMRCMREYEQIPITFDGQIPEYAFGEISDTRLIIGNKYLTSDENSNDVLVELIDCTVSEKEKKVYCIYKFENGQTSIEIHNLSDLEMQAYKRYPDTFFGVYKKQDHRAKDALDLYDFFYGVYKNTAKEKLLEFLKGHRDMDAFEKMSQEELARVYCEMLAYSAIRQPKPRQTDK
jgi:hypothetical protein